MPWCRSSNNNSHETTAKEGHAATVYNTQYTIYSMLSRRQPLFPLLSNNKLLPLFCVIYVLVLSDTTLFPTTTTTTTTTTLDSWMQRTLFSTITAAAMSTSAASLSSSSSSKAGALIFLHGLGDTPAGWSDLQRILPGLKPRLSQLEYVFPAAPTIPISINGGMKMPGWFDLYDWPIEVGAKDDPEGLQAGVATVEQHVQELNAKGIPSEKIVVGGFSQGGAIAVLAAYQAKTSYAGCVGLSAWLTLPDQLNVSEQAKKTPLYWGHGTYDDKVVFAQQSFGVGKLREQGVDVKDESFNMGHSSHPDEMDSFANFVDQCIFSKETADAVGTPGKSEL